MFIDWVIIQVPVNKTRDLRSIIVVIDYLVEILSNKKKQKPNMSNSVATMKINCLQIEVDHVQKFKWFLFYFS